MTTATETDRRIIDAYAVALDETFYIAPEDQPYVARIMGTYVFDRNEHTHCCEWTPSYYLIFVSTSIVLTDAGEALGESAREELYERYETEPSEDGYFHCHEIDRIIDAGKPFTVDHYGDVAQHDLEDGIEDADERHHAEMEAIREDLSCNHPF